MPTFSDKKGEKPDNHILRFTDYCNHYNIVLAQKSNEFVKTLTGKARAWANAVPRVGAPPHLPPFERAADVGPDPEEERQTLRHQFITRFAPQGRTPEALYSACMPNGKTSVSTPVKMTLKNSLMMCGNYLRSLCMVPEQP